MHGLQTRVPLAGLRERRHHNLRTHRFIPRRKCGVPAALTVATADVEPRLRCVVLRLEWFTVRAVQRQSAALSVDVGIDRSNRVPYPPWH